jgi:hypothetical protein
MTDKPVFTDPFYIDKFMEIQQQNIVLYKSLLRIYEKIGICSEFMNITFFPLISLPGGKNRKISKH